MLYVLQIAVWTSQHLFDIPIMLAKISVKISLLALMWFRDIPAMRLFIRRTETLIAFMRHLLLLSVFWARLQLCLGRWNPYWKGLKFQYGMCVLTFRIHPLGPSFCYTLLAIMQSLSLLFKMKNIHCGTQKIFQALHDKRWFCIIPYRPFLK